MRPPEPVVVDFSPADLDRAKEEARARVRASRRMGLKPADGAPDGEAGDWLHLWGAKGELATSIALGIPWTSSAGKLHLPDVGPVEVKARGARDYDLNIPLRAVRSRAFVHTFVPHERDGTRVLVLGWIIAANGMRPEWKATRRKNGTAYWVPQWVQAPIPELERVYRDGLL